MKTSNLFNQGNNKETNSFRNFENDVLTNEDLLLIKGGDGDGQNGQTDTVQEDGFN